jgi:hypothetical protein
MVNCLVKKLNGLPLAIKLARGYLAVLGWDKAADLLHMGWGHQVLPTPISSIMMSSLGRQTDAHNSADLNNAVFDACLLRGGSWEFALSHLGNNLELLRHLGFVHKRRCGDAATLGVNDAVATMGSILQLLEGGNVSVGKPIMV